MALSQSSRTFLGEKNMFKGLAILCYVYLSDFIFMAVIFLVYFSWVIGTAFIYYLFQFNLAIEDHDEIQAKAKDAYSKVHLLKGFNICIEILLKTSDGDTLVLETWHLNMNTSNSLTDSPYISHTSLASVYCRMTLLLKSAIAVTRITPAYRLSIRQSADTYVILYRIYSYEPQVNICY